MTSSQLMPALIIPLIAWRVYVRVRRNIGRQPFHPKRLMIGVVLFSVICLLLGLSVAKFPAALAALGGGLLVGLPLAMLGLRLTKFEFSSSGKFYTPNTYLGLVLTLLLLCRMAYRLVPLLTHSSPTGSASPPLFQSPLTLLLFALIAGYYITYNLGVLKRGRSLHAS